MIREKCCRRYAYRAAIISRPTFENTDSIMSACFVFSKFFRACVAVGQKAVLAFYINTKYCEEISDKCLFKRRNT